MNLFNLTAATILLIPTIALSAGPTQPEPGDLPPNVNTGWGGGIGGGSSNVDHGITWYFPASTISNEPGVVSKGINCNEKPKDCVEAMKKDSQPEDDPEGNPEGNPPGGGEGEGGKGGGFLSKIFKKKDKDKD